MQPSTEQVSAQLDVDAAHIRITDRTAEVVEATLYVAGWKLAARSKSLDGLRELLTTQLESSIQSYPNLPNLSQSSVLRNVAENITDHITAQWEGTAIANAELKEAKSELKEAEAKLNEAKVELKKGKDEHPTLEHLIELLKQNCGFCKIEGPRGRLADRKETLETSADYIEAVYKRHASAFCDGDKRKIQIGATGGTPGIGKTALLNEIALDAIEQKFPAIAVTFNGQGALATRMKEKVKEGLQADNAFANALLETAFGIKNTNLPFGDVVYVIREAACHFHKLPSSPVRPLVMCIDELAHLDDTIVEGTPLSIKLASDLMHHSDCADEKLRVICIFSHIQYTLFTDGMKTKGRTFYKDALFPLPLLRDTRAALELLADRDGVDKGQVSKLIKAYKEVPTVTAFIDGLGGPPRAIFEGLKRAIDHRKAQEFFQGNEVGLKMACECVFSAVELVSADVDTTVRRAFQLPPPVPLAQGKEEETLVNSGVILQANGRQVVSPVALMQWARLAQNEEQNQVDSFFFMDQVVARPGSEKAMEAICYRHDAALRAFNAPMGGMSKPFRLKEYYVGGTMDKKVGLLQVTMKRPLYRDNREENCLTYVDHFEKDSVLKLLHEGRIVVSNKHSEQGIAYLVPFHAVGDETQLIVAAVQCKFVGAKSKLSWAKVLGKIVKSVNRIFSPKNIVFVNKAVNERSPPKKTVPPRPIFVPVIMNTVPTTTATPQGNVKTNAIAFNAAGLQQYFFRITALRLQIETATKQIQIKNRK